MFLQMNILSMAARADICRHLGVKLRDRLKICHQFISFWLVEHRQCKGAQFSWNTQRHMKCTG